MVEVEVYVVMLVVQREVGIGGGERRAGGGRIRVNALLLSTFLVRMCACARARVRVCGIGGKKLTEFSLSLISILLSTCPI